MPKKGKTKVDEEVAQLANLLRNEHGEDGILVSQCEFWTALRARLSENDAAVGLEALGDLAMTILSSDDNASLAGKVLLLPPPDEMGDDEGEYTAMVPTPPIPLPKPSATSSDIEEPHSGFTEDAPVLEDTPPAPKNGPRSAGFSWPNQSGVVEL
ncbi:hypothetical protein PF004_g5519 [Phytophthora fragariae]|uniref:Uncharacterized protein n=1 Tax=Phytophthora fragariae TaxID=53985 RepID=A0A6G0S734_9STRA|nr:hypothetical protein PF004_g5519 [Phytophthora fragariae]KAE9350876.1 hypothetical protein PF008_g6220 [Phytophthora fragariae]